MGLSIKRCAPTIIGPQSKADRSYRSQLLIPPLQTGVKWRSWDNHSKSILYRLGCDNPFAIKRENMCRYQWVSTHGGHARIIRKLSATALDCSGKSCAVAEAEGLPFTIGVTVHPGIRNCLYCRLNWASSKVLSFFCWIITDLRNR